MSIHEYKEPHLVENPDDDYYNYSNEPAGWCPKCNKIYGLFNFGGSEFGWCDEHKLVWNIGWNVLMEKDYSEENEVAVKEKFKDYMDRTGEDAESGTTMSPIVKKIIAQQNKAHANSGADADNVLAQLRAKIKAKLKEKT